MGTWGAGRPPVTPEARFADQLEEATFALEEASQKFALAERLEAEAGAEMKLANQTIKALMRQNGYRHFRETA